MDPAPYSLRIRIQLRIRLISSVTLRLQKNFVFIFHAGLALSSITLIQDKKSLPYAMAVNTNAVDLDPEDP